MSAWSGLGRLLTDIAARCAALVVVPKALPVDEAERLRGRGRRVFYVLEEAALSDRLALVLACRQLGLPSPTRRMGVGGQTFPHAMLFLQRHRGWLRRRPDRRLPARWQLLAEAAGTPQPIRHEIAQHTHAQIGGPGGAQFAFRSLFDILVRQQPEVLQ